MYLYHGSAKKFAKLQRRQAWAPPGRPAEERRNAIYLTKDFAFALISGASPIDQVTEVNHDERTVHFEDPSKFNPEQQVYIYIVDSTKIPADKQEWFDDNRQVVVDLDEIEPDNVEVHKASEIYQHYKIYKII